ncbi:MAG: phage tail protein [Solirubrobacteraceae bacterium]
MARQTTTRGWPFFQTADDPPDGATQQEDLATVLEQQAVTGDQGNHASRPIAALARRIWASLDRRTVSVDTGSEWIELGAPTPAGVVSDFAGDTAPDGWLLCDGSAVSRTTYASLFAVIGTKYGSGNGSTTFNLPDTRGRVTVGAGQGGGLTDRTLAALFGVEAHQLTTTQMPSHNHSGSTGSGGSHNHPASTATAGAHTHLMTHPTGRTQMNPGPILYAPGGSSYLDSYTIWDVWGTAQSAGAHAHAVTIDSAGSHAHSFSTSNAGSGGSHPNVQPSIALNKIIKA